MSQNIFTRVAHYKTTACLPKTQDYLTLPPSENLSFYNNSYAKVLRLLVSCGSILLVARKSNNEGVRLQPKRIELLREVNSLSVITFEALLESNVAALLYPNSTPKQLRQRLQITLQQLSNTQLIQIGTLGDTTIIKSTDKGRRRLLRYDLDKITLQKPKRWDGTWHMVLFDIPEKHKVARNALNLKLRQIKMFKLADSIWVSPYPIDEIVIATRLAYEIDPFVRLVHADYVEDERYLRKIFGLPETD